MTLDQLIAQLRGQMATKLEQRNGIATQLTELRAADTIDEAKVEELRAQKTGLDAELDQMQLRVKELEEEKARDDAADRLAREVNPGAEKPKRAHDQVARVGAEERTYRPDTDPKGVDFARDVVSSFLGDFEAKERLARHSQEEVVERRVAVTGAQQRAVGTGAFAGLVVPQYLVDMFAPMATAGRPFADACRHHDLPPTGMTVNLGRGTTGTSVDDQASENAAVAEQDYDDTLLTINVRTAAGQQTVSRQGAERGIHVDDTIIEDLYKRYHANVDNKTINLASTGLTNVATAVTYTDASPTVEELYPKIIEGLAGVEGALLDMASGENIAVMHSRRWYHLQNAMSTKWPIISQPGIVEKTIGANYAERYGSGVRGVLPNGTPVIVDNNIATNLGAGTNEDEIYLGDKNEFHLWEDPNAPLLIRAEQAKAASLGILLVVYGYYAFTHQRYAHARKISGTGLVTPTYTGV
ncbi:phage major capsid protein [Lentzea sp. NPDC059081]|uniref:phage major capsid protein n=1 Tax=Lentzea sp. NPDC059081 TaxID=3346719 RepID=UPI0036910999